MARKCKGGDRGSSYDKRERRLWLIGAKESVRYGRAPFGGDGTHVDCIFCKVPLTRETLTVDRKIPGSKGGSYRYSNIQPCCDTCNKSRGDMPAKVFAARFAR